MGIKLPNVKKMGLIVRGLFLALFAIAFYFPSLATGQDNQYEPLVSGMKNYREGNYAKALDEFQKAAILFPDDPDIPFYTGLTHLRLNQLERAIEYFKKTLGMDPAYLDAHFQLGIVLIQQRAYEDAITHLEEVHKKEADREDLGYFLGLAYYQSGKYPKALESLEAATTKDRNIESLTLYYTALAKQELGLGQEAVGFYSQVITRDPTSPLADLSRRLRETLRAEQELKKRFHLEVTAKLQYDTNVILVPATNVFNLRDKDKKSLANLLFLKGEYFFARKPGYDLSASYGLYQAIYYNVKHNDVQDHILSAGFLSRNPLGVPGTFRFNYSYDYLLQDYSYFLQRHTVTPSLLFEWSPSFLSFVQYSFQSKTFAHENTEAFPEDKRDALNHQIGFFQFLTFGGGRNHLKAGYFYEREAAKGDNWDYSGNNFLAGFQYAFPKDVQFNLDYGYKPIHYKNPNIFFEEEGKRKDIERDFTVALSKEVTKNLAVSLEYLNRRNTSHIALFGYKKNLYSLGATWRF